MIRETSFYSLDELTELGFKSIGSGCLISRNAHFYGAADMTFGDNVRIDDFCILSGRIFCGSNIHISAYTALYGSEGIFLDDYTGISARTTVYSAMDDFSGDYLIGSMSPADTSHVTGGPVVIKRYSQICAHCVVLPNLTIGEGTIVGACSMVRRSLGSWGIYYGIPATFKRERKKGLLSKIDIR